MGSSIRSRLAGLLTGAGEAVAAALGRRPEYVSEPLPRVKVPGVNGWHLHHASVVYEEDGSLSVIAHPEPEPGARHVWIDKDQARVYALPDGVEPTREGETPEVQWEQLSGVTALNERLTDDPVTDWATITKEPHEG